MPTFIDMARANRMIDFIETLCIPEGMHQGKPFILRPWQRPLITDVYAPVDGTGIRIVRKAIYSVAKKQGKGLALDTLLPTPTGWTTMGGVKPGDVLYDECGNECKVTFESDIKNLACYEVNFSNGERLACDEQHLWLTTSLSVESVKNIKTVYNTQHKRHTIKIQYPFYYIVQITSVKKIPSVPTKCIRVDSPNSLFLCGKTMIPTHNTPIVAGIALGHLIGPEAKRNEQIYSAAFERDQAALTFRYMCQMIQMDEELSDLTIIRTTKKEIESRPNGSIYKALSSEARSKHGISPAVLIFDELAQFGASREFYDTLIQGRGAHEEPLLWIISTQAADDLAVLSQEIDYALAHAHEDPTVKLFFFTTPPEADLQDREAWKLSNPALGDFLSEADMIEAANTAVNMPSAEGGFRNLRLNQRISATSRFMSNKIWKENGEKQNPDALTNGRITAGLDLSGKNDLSSLVVNAFYEKTHNIFSYFWTPLDNAKERSKQDRVPYLLWIKQGFIEGVPGKTIDYEYIAKKVAEIHWMHHIDELRFDRWRIDDFQRALNNIGCESYVKDKEDPPTGDALCLVNHGQGYKDMTPAIESIEDIFTESKARHNNHPVLTMCAANAVVEFDPADNRKFAKHKSTGRIDGIVAMAMALNGSELPDIVENRVQPMPIFV